MNNPILTAGQFEFAEIFQRLERDFKISRADVARALRIERSYVTMLVNGQRTPHIRILESMRELEKRMVAERESEAAAGEGTDLSRLVQQLKVLEQADRPRFEVARQVVEALAQTSLKAGPAARKLLDAATDSQRGRARNKRVVSGSGS